MPNKNGLSLYNALLDRITKLNEKINCVSKDNYVNDKIREELIGILINYFGETREHLLGLKKVYVSTAAPSEM